MAMHNVMARAYIIRVQPKVVLGVAISTIWLCSVLNHGLVKDLDEAIIVVVRD
jgi:hypothetical protein